MTTFPRPTITSDLDGVLNHYPDCWVEFINSQAGRDYLSKEEALEDLGETRYGEFKHAYRLSDFKANLPPRREALKLLSALHTMGHPIVVTTSRPFQRYPKLYDTTLRWLKTHSVPFTSLEAKARDSFSRISDILFHIEDDPDDAAKVASWGHRVLLVGTEPSRVPVPTNSLITPATFDNVLRFAMDV